MAVKAGQTMSFASDLTRRASSSAAVCASSTRRSNLPSARRRAVAPRRSALRSCVDARRCRVEICRFTPAWLRRGLTVSATFSPAETAAPTAVSATCCARQPNDFRVPACARARVSAALLADRLRRAAFRRRVATPFCAAAFRCVLVGVAMSNHPSCGSLATQSCVPKPQGGETSIPYLPPRWRPAEV